MEMTARELGSNPFDWWGTMRPIPQDKWRSVEVYNTVTNAWEALTEVPEFERNVAPPLASFRSSALSFGFVRSISSNIENTLSPDRAIGSESDAI